MFENMLLNENELEMVAGGLPIILPRRWNDPSEDKQMVCQKSRRAAAPNGAMGDEDEYIPSRKWKYLR